VAARGPPPSQGAHTTGQGAPPIRTRASASPRTLALATTHRTSGNVTVQLQAEERFMVNWVALSVFIVLFLLVTVLGFVAARWRQGDLNQLNEWGLGGRRFGTVVTWFLLGGDLYTAYTFIAVPALLFGTGASAFFAVPYTIIAYPLIFVFMPKLWSVAHKHGYITPADFVRGRYGSGGLGLAVAFTGILATMPYIALQLVGLQVIIAALGITGSGYLADLPLVIAFVILAAYTYNSGLRAPAMIALVKDALIYLTVIVAVIVIPIQLGGWGHIFQVAGVTLPKRTPPGALLLGSKGYISFATLALGSALALFMYPHSVTGVLSSNSRKVIRRNAALLPAYSLVLGLLALLGYMAIAAGVSKNPTYAAGFAAYKGQYAVPALILNQFPGWFVGIAFAAIAIGALVPAAVMSIAAANLFTRNIYKEYLRPGATTQEEARVAKLTSLVVKLGALAFIVFAPVAYAIQLQLLGGIWIIQTFPAIVIGLYTRWFHRWALLIGWACGMITGTLMAYSQGFISKTGAILAPVSTWPAAGHPVSMFGLAIPSAYAAVYSLFVNFVVAGVLTLVFRALRVNAGQDATAPADYTSDVVGEPLAMPAGS
jgi:SSS family solute:Na+ symporter